jgi:hypothetical protein
LPLAAVVEFGQHIRADVNQIMFRYEIVRLTLDCAYAHAECKKSAPILGVAPINNIAMPPGVAGYPACISV